MMLRAVSIRPAAEYVVMEDNEFNCNMPPDEMAANIARHRVYLDVGAAAV